MDNKSQSQAELQEHARKVVEAATPNRHERRAREAHTRKLLGQMRAHQHRLLDKMADKK